MTCIFPCVENIITMVDLVLNRKIASKSQPIILLTNCIIKWSSANEHAVQYIRK